MAGLCEHAATKLINGPLPVFELLVRRRSVNYGYRNVNSAFPHSLPLQRDLYRILARALGLLGGGQLRRIRMQTTMAATSRTIPKNMRGVH